MGDLYKIKVNDLSFMKSNCFLTYGSELIFCSALAYSKLANVSAKIVNSKNKGKANDLYFYSSARGRLYASDAGYDVISKKDQSTDITHMIISSKDKIMIENNGSEVYRLIAIGKTKDEAIDVLYKKIMNATSVPLLYEWKEYVMQELQRRISTLTTYTDDNEEEPMYGYIGILTKEILKEILKNGLKEKSINIMGCNEESIIMKNVNGINDYLGNFGEVLAEKIQSSFRPLFVPGEDEYDKFNDYVDDYMFDKAKIELYLAQKSTIQAAVNNLRTQNASFLIAEMGAGKTTMGAAIPYVHHSNMKKGLNAVVMCPAHLTDVWDREILERIPNAKTYVIKDYTDLIKLNKKLKNKNKVENSYIILSKEKAKLSYDKRPAAIWNKCKETFVCPDCGQALYTIEKEPSPYHASKKVDVRKNFTATSMMKRNATNKVCMNEVRTYDTKTNRFEIVPCNAKLWTASNRNDENHKWFKIGAEGWLYKEHVIPLTETLMSKDNITRQETALLKQLMPQYELHQDGKELYAPYKGPRRYSAAKYIREKMKDVFDYCVIDECHDAKGLSEQGMAAADLIRSSKKSILLTGTLLNGYASGLYYLLWRTVPNLMRKEGFRFNDESEFAKIYGVESKETRYRVTENGRVTNRRVGSTRQKELPGVSPLVFTKFLLKIASFLSLSDMAEGLPNYTEIPTAITMPYDLANNYTLFENAFREYTSGYASKKAVGSFVRCLLNYVDSPHMAKPIINPETGDIIYEPVIMSKQTREKEEELLRITKRKLANGEKVMIYYTDINGSDIGKTLVQLFKDNNITAYELTSKVKASERETWINNKLDDGMQVMICNPKLVETGLTLLDFTTIIFFQTGYNLTTMRQASRRSWRLSQKHDVEVYFLYYQGCIQEQALSLMATKLQAAMAIEGKFSEEGLRALNDNQDLLTQIANNVVEGMKNNLNKDIFKAAIYVKKTDRSFRVHPMTAKLLTFKMNDLGEKILFNKDYSIKRKVVAMDEKLSHNPLQLFF